MPTKTITVPTITCRHCTHTIKTELEGLEGVLQVEGDAGTKAVSVTWEDPAQWDAIHALLEEIGHAPE